MRSRASFRGHPIHPMLIPFPLAFLTGALAADAAGLIVDNEDLWVTAWYLTIAGIVMALVAALPGLVDYLYTVPPSSSGKKRATKHAIVNLSAVGIFTICWILRGGPGVAPDLLIVLLELAGAGLLALGGWMGGTLSFRNQIGVDHRYARAGKWKEARVKPSTEWIRVAGADELEVDQMKLLHVGGDRIVLARTIDAWVAFDDHCPHRGGSLAGGIMACGTVSCPWHGSQFDVASGTLRAGPAETGLATYPVERRNNEIFLKR